MTEQTIAPVDSERGVWILTSSGKAFNPLRPDPALITITDIAHALSHMCRFNGHCRELYSVGEHSWRMSFIVPAEHALTALLHDATEAYIADICRPVKPHLQNYADIEYQLWQAISTRFFLPLDMPPEVKHADLVMLATEKRDLMPHHAAEWECLNGIEPLHERIVPIHSAHVRRKFIERFAELSQIRDGLTGLADAAAP